MSNNLRFDIASHRYYVDGQEYPSVTTILKRLYDFSGIPEPVLEFARERGSAVHKGCELMLRNSLDLTSVDEEVGNYLTAFSLFLTDTDFEPSYIEKSFHNTTFRYAGTPDIPGVIHTKTGPVGAVIDIKTSSVVHKVTALQLAGYQRLLREYGSFDHRYALHLKRDGTYRLEPFRDPNDINVFFAELTSHYWREKNHVK